MLSTPLRVQEAVLRHGLGPTARLAFERLSPNSAWTDESIWYRMDLGSPSRPRLPLDAGLDLRKGGVADVPLLERLPIDPSVATNSRSLVKHRLGMGATLWLVAEGDRPAFRCWTFVDRAPLAGFQEVALPPGHVFLEDTLSSPAFRGRGVAPSAWTLIADAEAAEGRRTMVTIVSTDNLPSRRAVEKAGFSEFARMYRAGPLWRMRTRVDFTDGAPTERWLAAVQRG